METPKEIMN